MLDTMKTLTSREFFHSPSLVKSLHPGQSFGVTDNGKASFIVTKAGKLPRRTKEDLEQRAHEIFKRNKVRGKFNFTKVLRELKGR